MHMIPHQLSLRHLYLPIYNVYIFIIVPIFLLILLVIIRLYCIYTRHFRYSVGNFIVSFFCICVFTSIMEGIFDVKIMRTPMIYYGTQLHSTNF